jgi:predicted NBD/HSP70 family sugar kinase
MIEGGSWDAPTYASVSGLKVGIAPTVKGPEGRSMISNSNANNIFVGTKHLDATWKWVTYMGSEDCQSAAGVDGTFLPSIAASMKVAEDAQKTKGVDLGVFTNALENKELCAAPPTVNGQELADTLKPMFEAYFSGETDDTTFADMEKKTSTILANQARIEEQGEDALGRPPPAQVGRRMRETRRSGIVGFDHQLTGTTMHHATVDLLAQASPAAVDVFTQVLTRGPISRIDVARLTGLSQAAVTKAIAPLVTAGVVGDAHHAEDAGRLGAGRPAHPLRVDPNALVAFGVKVSSTEIIAVATGFTANILTALELPLADTQYHTVVDGILQAVRGLTEKLGSHAGNLGGVCVSVSGDVDTARGVVRESGLLGWIDQPLGTTLHDRLGYDVRALTIAEHWFGLGVGTESFAIVTIGSGIGCGLHINGDVVEGAYGVAGEIGHLPLASPDHICTCGRRGCVESVAASGAIVRAIRGATGRTLTLQDAVNLAHAGDPTAVDVFDRAGSVIGRAIATMVNLTGPELVVISGEAVVDYDLYDQRLREAFTEHAFGAAVNCRIVTRPNIFVDWAKGAAAAVVRAIVTQTYPTTAIAA